MKYRELVIKTSESGVEPVLAKLSSIGIDNAEVRDPADVREIMKDKKTYEWDYIDDSLKEGLDSEPEIVIYLDEEDEESESAVKKAAEELKEDLKSGLFGAADLGSLEISSEVRDDSEWKDKWKEYFKPTKVSDRIVVKPGWEEYEADDGEIVIEIDPGMAFGTGTHETTSMCLELLDSYVEKGDKVLDVGCGSGILSIAAAKLGAGEVVGVDIDEEAVRVSEENFGLNGVSEVASAKLGDVTKGIDEKADIVAANLMAELIVMTAPGVRKCMKDGGIFIASGILEEKEEMVEEALEKAGLDVIDGLKKGEWVAIVASLSE